MRHAHTILQVEQTLKAAELDALVSHFCKMQSNPDSTIPDCLSFRLCYFNFPPHSLLAYFVWEYLLLKSAHSILSVSKSERARSQTLKAIR